MGAGAGGGLVGGSEEGRRVTGEGNGGGIQNGRGRRAQSGEDDSLGKARSLFACGEKPKGFNKH